MTTEHKQNAKDSPDQEVLVTPEKKSKPMDAGGTPETADGDEAASLDGLDGWNRKDLDQKQLFQVPTGDSSDVEPDSQKDDNDDAKASAMRRKKICLFALLIVVVAAGTTAAVFLIGNDDERVQTNGLDREIPGLGVTAAPVVGSTNSPTFAPTSGPTAGPTSGPTAGPTDGPTAGPTAGPTSGPTASPSMTPSARPSAVPSATPTTSAPSASPTIDRQTPLIQRVTSIRGEPLPADPNAPENMAIQFLLEESNAIDYDTVAQRFSMLAFEMTLNPAIQSTSSVLGGRRMIETVIIPGVNECSWSGVTCNGSGQVSEIRFGGRGLTGTISRDIGLLTSITRLELNDNRLSSSIPEKLYDLTNLQYLILYNNELTGTLSARVHNTQNLIKLFLNNNKFTGSIPRELRSSNSIRPLEYLNLYNNEFSGQIPSGLRLRKLFYFDVGRNQLTGQLPSDLGDTFAVLRHFHLDFNEFDGTLPNSYLTVGGGRLETFSVNDNKLTGSVPSRLEFTNKLVMFTLQNNDFDERINSRICNLSVLRGGENVEFKADCDICRCSDFFCNPCF